MDILLNYGLIIIGFVLSIAASVYVESQYARKKRIMTDKGMTGAEVARFILDKNGLFDVQVSQTSGMLSDHYDPRNKTVNLSTDIYNNSSIASVAVAAHEVGHAIQDKEGDTFLRIRHSLVPITNFASFAGYIAIGIGLISTIMEIFWIGIILLLVILLFELVTLPVEFGASHRAIKELDESFILQENEVRDCKSMLRAAAMTYVAAVITTLLEVARLVLMVVLRSRSDD